MKRAYPIVLFALLGAVYAMNTLVDVSGTGTAPRVRTLAREQRPDDVLFAEREIDQRAWVKAKLEQSCPEQLVFGSSTVGGIASDMLPGGPFLNAWLTGPSMEDYEAFTELLERAGCRPRRILVGVDPWLFNAMSENDRWLTLHAEVLAYHGGVRAIARFGPPGRRAWSVMKERLSFVTSTESFAWLLDHRHATHGSAAPHLVPTAQIDAACASAAVIPNLRYDDGHFTRCERFQPHGKDIIRIAEHYLVADIHDVGKWKAVDRSRLDRLGHLIAKWRARGTAVTLLTPPYHPRTYRVLRERASTHRLLDELDAALAALADRTGSKLLAVRDPARVGCGDDDFYDSHHERPACLKRVSAMVRDPGESSMGGRSAPGENALDR